MSLMSSNNTETKATGNSNEWINLIEKAIAKNCFKYYEIDHFSNIQEIDSGSFGKVYRANWKETHGYIALKSYFNLNDITVKEIVNEVIIMKYIHIFFLYISNSIYNLV
jgi:hypothetical protein